MRTPADRPLDDRPLGRRTRDARRGRAARRAAASAALAVAAVLAPAVAPAAATAEEAPALEVDVAAPDGELAVGQAVPLTVTVTNRGPAGCALAGLAAGALRVVRVTRDGAAVQPLLTHAHYEAGLPAAVERSLTRVEPGAGVTIDWSARSVGAGDRAALALVGVDALPGGDALRSHWPLDRPGTYEVTVRYEALGVVPDVCAGSSPVASAVLRIGEPETPAPGRTRAPAVALLVVLGLLGAVAVVLLLRRRRVATGALVLVLALGWGTAAAPPAEARLDVMIGAPEGGTAPPAGWHDAVARCRAELRDPSRHDAATRAYVDWVLDPDTPSVLLFHEPGSSGAALTPDPTDDPRATMIWWEHRSTEDYESGVPRDPCTALFHEIVHAKRLADPREPPEGGFCGAEGPLREEAFATLMENRYRAHNGMPQRTTYMGAPLPARFEDCGPPESAEPGPGSEGLPGYAESVGDPHLGTFDGVRFSPQAVGELVLVTSTAGDLVVQARQTPLRDSRTVAVTSAVAVRAGADRVTFTLATEGAEAVVVRVGGEVVAVPRGELPLAGGAVLHRGPPARGFGPDAVRVTWPDGSVVEVDPVERSGLRVHVGLTADRAGTVSGLLGTDDGDPANDLTTRDGTVLSPPLGHEELYGALVDSWRVRPDESAFDYADGESTETFTDRSFPDDVPQLEPAAQARAAAVCRAAQVTDAALLEECVLDVAASGDAAFAVAAGEVQSRHDARAGRAPDPGPSVVVAADAVTTVPLTGQRVTVELVAAGAVARLAFDAAAGQVVHLEATDATLPDGCGVIALAGPSGSGLLAGCLSGGAGSIERTVLAAGPHTVVVDPDGDATGRVTLRLVTVVDDVQPGTLGGAAVAVTAQGPGAHGVVTFDAVAGQVVFVEADGASPALDGCGSLRLVGPDGSTLQTGCVRGGQGFLDATVLPANGPYTVVVDPPTSASGDPASARLRLVAPLDQHEDVVVGGAAVRARIEQPGAVARLRFTGAAGQDVVVRLSGATVADQCGVVRLLGPDGRQVRSGCVLDGAGELRHTVDDAGEHVVLVDLRARETGEVTVAVG